MSTLTRFLGQVVLVASLATAFVTITVTPASAQPPTLLEVLEQPWVITMIVEEDGHAAPVFYNKIWFDTSALCQDWLGSDEFAADLAGFKAATTEHDPNAKFGVPRCIQRGTDGQPA